MANRLCGNNAISVPIMTERYSESGSSGPLTPASLQRQQQQQQQEQNSTQPNGNGNFTNTAKLPIYIVKQLIAAVSIRPNLWIRNHNGHRRGEMNLLWHEVSKEVNLPVDICRIKWGHLRDNFRKVFIRNKLSGETPTTWRFYNDMAFMEASVAENVIRQNRYKTANRLMSDEDFYVPVPICELGENYARDVPSYNMPPYNVSGLFNGDTSTAQRPLKRAKLDPQASQLPLMQQMTKDIFKNLKGQNPESSYISNYSEQDVDEDDDFDEDAATEENDQEPVENNDEKKLNSDLFTIEVFDDDDEEEMRNLQKHNLRSGPTTYSEEDRKHDIRPKSAVSDDICNKSLSYSRSSNNETPASTADESKLQEDDADRMFLLSLVPYLKSIDAKRKLLIRQKLQNVLIDELG